MAVDLRDPAYADPAYRQANFDHIQDVVEVFFLLQTAQEAYHDGQARGLPIGPINSPDDLLHDEHLLAREFFVTVEHDDVPPAIYPGAPFRFSRYGTAPARAGRRSWVSTPPRCSASRGPSAERTEEEADGRGVPSP